MPADIFSQHILVYIHTTLARFQYSIGTARYSFSAVLCCSAENKYVTWLVDWSNGKDPFPLKIVRCIEKTLAKMYCRAVQVAGV